MTMDNCSSKALVKPAAAKTLGSKNEPGHPKTSARLSFARFGLGGVAASAFVLGSLACGPGGQQNPQPDSGSGPDTVTQDTHSQPDTLVIRDTSMPVDAAQDSGSIITDTGVGCGTTHGLGPAQTFRHFQIRTNDVLRTQGTRREILERVTIPGAVSSPLSSMSLEVISAPPACTSSGSTLNIFSGWDFSDSSRQEMVSVGLVTGGVAHVYLANFESIPPVDGSDCIHATIGYTNAGSGSHPIPGMSGKAMMDYGLVPCPVGGAPSNCIRLEFSGFGDVVVPLSPEIMASSGSHGFGYVGGQTWYLWARVQTNDNIGFVACPAPALHE